MIRKIIRINEEKCNGCGLCVPNCAEGAIRVIDGKARLVSDLFCDGLGACLGHCPEGAIEVTERESEPYNETRVMENIVPQGRNTILAHLDHLRSHGEQEYLREAIAYIRTQNIDMAPGHAGKDRTLQTAGVFSVYKNELSKPSSSCGCPGSNSIDFKNDERDTRSTAATPVPSELGHWPVQMHLIDPSASCYKGADVLLAADCVAYAMGDFHNRLLRGKSLAIACPKLDVNTEIYIEKLIALINQSGISSLTVAIMQVPCCSGLVRMVMAAMEKSSRTIPVRKIVVSVKGAILQEEWL